MVFLVQYIHSIKHYVRYSLRLLYISNLFVVKSNNKQTESSENITVIAADKVIWLFEKKNINISLILLTDHTQTKVEKTLFETCECWTLPLWSKFIKCGYMVHCWHCKLCSIVFELFIINRWKHWLIDICTDHVSILPVRGCYRHFPFLG